MAASLLKKIPQNILSVVCRHRPVVSRYLSELTTNGEGETAPVKSTISSPTEGALLKFDKMVEQMKRSQTQTQTQGEDEEESATQNQSFATMLRKSNLIALGEDQDKRVIGKIIEVMEDDLYIDFGGKFHCVCRRPRKNGELYQRGTEVIVSLKAQEMSSAFLGSDVHITLLEADAILLGLLSKPKRQTDPDISTSTNRGSVQ